MEIEIKEFYPIEINPQTNYMIGTVKFDLPENGICMMGYTVIVKKGKWYFIAPYKRGYDEKQKMFVRYPTCAFIDLDAHKKLIAKLQEIGPDWIMNRLTQPDAPKPWPPKPKKLNDNKKPGFKKGPGQKPDGSKPENPVKIGSKVWVDPPKRPAPMKPRGGFGPR